MITSFHAIQHIWRISESNDDVLRYYRILRHPGNKKREALTAPPNHQSGAILAHSLIPRNRYIAGNWGIMMIRGLNHLTLAVRDVERAVAFYRDVLGFDVAKIWSGGAYLTAGPLWLCLSFDPDTRPEPTPDYTHAAFDIAAEDFETRVARVRNAGATLWKDNRSEGDSLYFLDPDGHKLELHVGSLHSRLAAMAAESSG